MFLRPTQHVLGPPTKSECSLHVSDIRLDSCVSVPLSSANKTNLRLILSSKSFQDLRQSFWPQLGLEESRRWHPYSHHLWRLGAALVSDQSSAQAECIDMNMRTVERMQITTETKFLVVPCCADVQQHICLTRTCSWCNPHSRPNPRIP